jgi:hypothetical protein
LPKKKFQGAADLCANLDEAKDMGDMVKALTP